MQPPFKLPELSYCLIHPVVRGCHAGSLYGDRPCLGGIDNKRYLYFKTDRNFALSFRHAFFQVSSQISCSGFATTDYTAFPSIGLFLMFILMFSGGSTGSTAGGIKIARHLISMTGDRLHCTLYTCIPGRQSPYAGNGYFNY